MARRRWWASTPLLILSLLTPATVATVFPDFSFYPTNSQPCMQQAGDASKCSGADVTELNECLCGNTNNFIILAAKCIGQNDTSDAVPVYQQLVSACATSNTPLVIAPNSFYAAVSGKPWTTTTTTTTTTTAAPTSTAATTTSDATTTSSTTTSTSSSTASAMPVGTLTTGATIGIALGASFGGVGAIAGLVYFLLRRSKQQGEEFHPMLPHGEDGRHKSLAISANEAMLQPTPSPNTASFSSEVKHQSWVSPLQSPDPYRYSAAAYDPNQGVYQGPYAPPGPIVELPPDNTHHPNHQTEGMVFEMDAQHMHTMPAEVPGDVPSVPRPGGR
ncbi:hypothetical protein GGI43DRAFT_259070 [Trichoderma evansii]